MNFEIAYQTQDLPPPFAYAFVIKGSTDSNYHFQVSLEFAYIGRDELSDEELRAEGFSRNDDFSWQGEVASGWAVALEGTLLPSSFQEEPDPLTYIHLSINGRRMGFPSKIDEANLLVQEFLQAILETSNREHPLSLRLCWEKNDIITYRWSFANRTFSSNQRKLEWQQGRALLELIYSLDLEAATSTKKPAPHTMELEEGQWLHIPSATFWEKAGRLMQE